MEIVKYFAKEWTVIAGAPVTFIFAAILLMGAAYAAASWRFGGIIATQTAKIDVLETKLENAPIAENVEKRRATRERLARFLGDGEALDGRARSEDAAIVTPLAEAWATDVWNWLAANLDESYAQQFLSSAGLPAVMVAAPIAEEQKAVALWLHYRNVRLGEFIQAFR